MSAPFLKALSMILGSIFLGNFAFKASDSDLVFIGFGKGRSCAIGFNLLQTFWDRFVLALLLLIHLISNSTLLAWVSTEYFGVVNVNVL